MLHFIVIIVGGTFVVIVLDVICHLNSFQSPFGPLLKQLVDEIVG